MNWKEIELALIDSKQYYKRVTTPDESDSNPFSLTPDQIAVITKSDYAEKFPATSSVLPAPIREFETGATRDTDADKLKYEGFISPLVEKRFAQYMHLHRKQSDGNLRAPDNWQKGIPLDAYADSLIRHVKDFHLHIDGFADEAVDPDIESVLCAIRFNVDGYLFELLKQKRAAK